jgi:hypothetical protein
MRKSFLFVLLIGLSLPNLAQPNRLSQQAGNVKQVNAIEGGYQFILSNGWASIQATKTIPLE